MNTPVWIGLGSNLGDRRAILDSALANLGEVAGVAVRVVSSYHETIPVGGPPGQGPFLNAAAHLETSLDPHQLLSVLQMVEKQAGRIRTIRWGERTLDLDILIYGTKFLDTKNLKLPHPRLAIRRFVLAPLAEIAPTIVDTMTRRSIADLLANLERIPRFLALEGPSSSLRSDVFRRLVDGLPALGIAEGEWLPGPESNRRRFDDFERKAEAIRADRWVPERLRPSWLVTDYCLQSDLARAITSIRDHLASLSRETIPFDAFYAEVRRIQDAEKRALAPTLAVRLPGSTWDRKPGRVAFPILWPESDDPDAIVDEILATCRAIEAV